MYLYFVYRFHYNKLFFFGEKRRKELDLLDLDLICLIIREILFWMLLYDRNDNFCKNKLRLKRLIFFSLDFIILLWMKMDSKQFCLEQNYNRLTISNGYQVSRSFSNRICLAIEFRIHLISDFCLYQAYIEMCTS